MKEQLFNSGQETGFYSEHLRLKNKLLFLLVLITLPVIRGEMYFYFEGKHLYVGPSRFYEWNKTAQSEDEYILNVCKDRCWNGQKVKYVGEDYAKTDCLEYDCFPCECERPMCEIYRICCLAMPAGIMETLEAELGLLSGANKTASASGVVSGSASNNTGAESSNGSLYESSNVAPETDSSNASIVQAMSLPPNWLLEWGWDEPLVIEEVQPIYCGSRDGAQGNLGLLMIRSCPITFLDSRVRELCEDNVDLDVDDVDVLKRQTLRVIDPKTSVTYYNGYCAQCNRITETVVWDYKCYCTHFMKVYDVMTEDELFRRTLNYNSSSMCTISQTVPKDDGLRVVNCSYYGHNADVIDTCNVTGRWTNYDYDILLACETGQSNYGIRMVVWDFIGKAEINVYKNVFCLICNENNPPWDYSVCPERDDHSAIGRLLPFSFLFGLSDRSLTRKEKLERPLCPNDQWPAPDGTCKLTHCAPGKLTGLFSDLNLSNMTISPNNSNNNDSNTILGENVDGDISSNSHDEQFLNLIFSTGLSDDQEVCVTSLPIISGLGYKLNLWFIPTTLDWIQDVPGSDLMEIMAEIRDAVMGNVTSIFEPVITGWQYSYGVMVQLDEQAWETAFSGTDTVMSSSSVQEAASGAGNPTGSEHQDFMVNGITALAFGLEAYLVSNINRSRDEVDSFLAALVLSKNLDLHVGAGRIVQTMPVVGPETLSIRGCTGNRKLCNTRMGAQGNFRTDKKLSWLFSEDIRLIRVSGLLTCKFVTFNSTEYSVTVNIQDALLQQEISLQFDNMQINFTEENLLNQMEINEEDGTLSVCVDALEAKLAPMALGEDEDESTMDFVNYVLTLTALGISLVCLVITVMTYGLFPVLRTAAGVNTMCLCGSLILAQVALLVSSHVSASGPGCVFLGVLTHFVWLCFFSWSFLCCLHMFRVFNSSNTRSVNTSSSAQARSLAKRVLFSVIGPLLVIAVVMIVEGVQSGGDTLGYGQERCYLDTGLLVACAMVAPLCVVTICNTTFFFTTVFNIHSVRRNQQSQMFKKNDHRDFYVYIKLSTLTGIFWAVTILAEVLEVDALRTVSILLNGLQGVFLFISYILNKRVTNMYRKSLGLNELPTTSSSTTRSTMSRLASFLRGVRRKDGNAAGNSTAGNENDQDQPQTEESFPQTEQAPPQSKQA